MRNWFEKTFRKYLTITKPRSIMRGSLRTKCSEGSGETRGDARSLTACAGILSGRLVGYETCRNIWRPRKNSS